MRQVCVAKHVRDELFSSIYWMISGVHGYYSMRWSMSDEPFDFLVLIFDSDTVRTLNGARTQSAKLQDGNDRILIVGLYAITKIYIYINIMLLVLTRFWLCLRPNG